jgi:hypothetical protein
MFVQTQYSYILNNYYTNINPSYNSTDSALLVSRCIDYLVEIYISLCLIEKAAGTRLEEALVFVVTNMGVE